MKKIILILSVIVYSKNYAQVGFGTSLPKASVDIEGDLRVSKLSVYNKNSLPVYWNEKTQMLERGAKITEKDTPKPFYTIKYKIKTGRDEDWISNYDTKITSSNNTVIITSAKFRKENGSLYIQYNGSVREGATHITSVFNFGSYVSDGTWRLQADYVNAAPGMLGTDYYWEIDVLVINNSLVTELPIETGNVNTGGGGQAKKSPIK